MAGKQMENDNISSNLAGMSMSQLYDIMSQMKILIEQNQEQAKQILVKSPDMTRSLFQAQILLGMVKTPQMMPSNQQALSQALQQSLKPVQPPSSQAKPLPVQVGQQEATQVQNQVPARKQQPNHHVSSVQSAAVLPVTHQSETLPTYSQQFMQPAKEHTTTHGASISHPQSSQVHTMPPNPQPSQVHTMPPHPQSSQVHTMPPHPQPSHVHAMPPHQQSSQVHTMSPHPQSSQVHTVPPHSQSSQVHTMPPHPQSSQVHPMPPHQFNSAQQPPSFHQTQKPNMSSHSHQSLHSQGTQHHSLQPPLPSQPRPPSMQPIQHQHHSQTGPRAGFQTSAPFQSHTSQQQFNGDRNPASIGFPTQPIPNQTQFQSPYQGGSHLNGNFNHQGGGSNTQMDRPTWMSGRPGPPENSTGRSQLPGPPPLPGQMGPGNQTPRPPQLTSEMEKVLLQQVMSLTPEQINLLPPEQRNQVLQLQQLLR